VSPEESMSDHRIILFNLRINVDCSKPTRNPRKTNWEKYSTTLERNLAGISSGIPRLPSKLEEVVDSLNTGIINAYERSCAIGKKRKAKDAPWWSDSLERLRIATRRLFNRAKTDGMWDQYRESLTFYNKEIRKAKRKNYRDFCESIENTTEGARLHRALSKRAPDANLALKWGDNTFTSSNMNKLKLLFETHFLGSIPLRENVDRVVVDQVRPVPEDWAIAKSTVTLDRLKWAIGTFQPYKSPGLDGISPAFLQQGQSKLLPILRKVMISSLALGHIPNAWSRARVVFIPKTGKKDITHPKSFRPISLTSFLLKTLEKLVDNKIRSTISRN